MFSVISMSPLPLGQAWDKEGNGAAKNLTAANARNSQVRYNTSFAPVHLMLLITIFP